MATKNVKISSLEKTRKRRVRTVATVFLLPTFLLIAVYYIYPVIDTFIISAYKWNGISSDRTFIGLQNWNTLVHDKNFWSAFGRNVIIMVFSILLQIPIGLFLASFLEAGGKRYRRYRWRPCSCSARACRYSRYFDEVARLFQPEQHGSGNADGTQPVEACRRCCCASRQVRQGTSGVRRIFQWQN